MEAFMKAARAPRADKTNVKLLVVKDGEIDDSSIGRLADHLRPRDLLVVNDAATLPASLPARDAMNNQIELRLTTQLDERVWQAVVFGAGDWRAPTENRPSPPRFAEGEEILIAPDFRAKVRGEDQLSERLLNLEFNLSGEEL
jgi:S-adenosylmethionine:tRNA ribosyltransferase-isomerase